MNVPPGPQWLSRLCALGGVALLHVGMLYALLHAFSLVSPARIQEIKVILAEPVAVMPARQIPPLPVFLRPPAITALPPEIPVAIAPPRLS